MHRLLDSAGVLSVKQISPQKGEYSPYPPQVSSSIKDGLQKSGISQLYTHQAEAINKIMSGKNTIITTSTSSGKSLIYTIPVLYNTNTRAVYLTPAKALGQNQKKTVNNPHLALTGLEVGLAGKLASSVD